MIVYDILSVTDEMVKKEDIREVTSSKIFLRPGEPDEEGLASYEIFGYPGTEQRKKQFGYINLNDYFVHPHCLFELKSIKKIYIDLINGDGTFYLKDGDVFRAESEVPKDAEKVGSGASFLYSIWNKLKFDYGDLTSGVRYTRLRFLKSLDKSQVFMNKILVIPPFYRDVDVRKGGKKNEYNNFYVKIMNLAQTMKSTKTMFGSLNDGSVSDSYKSINETLMEMHEKIIKMYGGRKGFIHKYVMGKSIDFSARLVISCLDLSTSISPSKMNANFEKSMVPLFAVIKCFAPFIVNGVREIINDYLQGNEYIFIVKDDNKLKKHAFSEHTLSKISGINKSKISRVRLANDWQTTLSSSYIYNLIELYHDSHEHRLDKFKLPTEDGGEVEVGFYINDDEEIELETDIERASQKIVPLRLVHLFYMAAMDKISDKHIYITRYPIEDHNNTYPSGINIIPYKRTARIRVGDTVYENFPIVDYKKDIKVISTMFSDTLTIFPGYTSALGADFDGDQVSILGVFSNEANRDAKNHLLSPGNMAAIDGSSTRTLGALATQVIHGLTF